MAQSSNRVEFTRTPDGMQVVWRRGGVLGSNVAVQKVVVPYDADGKADAHAIALAVGEMQKQHGSSMAEASRVTSKRTG